MKFKRFGIEFCRLQRSEIEMLRQWRNDDKIRQFYFYKDLITQDQQQVWFSKIDNECNFYFIIKLNGVPVGLIHASEIDWRKGEAFVGLFIYADRYMGTNVPVLSSLGFLDVMFEIFGLEQLFAKVMGSNSVAVEYNKKLGFRYVEELDQPGGQLFLLTVNHYRHKTQLKEYALQTKGNGMEIELNHDDLITQPNVCARIDRLSIQLKERLAVTILKESPVA